MLVDEAMGLVLGNQHALCRASTCSSQEDGDGPQGQNAELRYMAGYDIWQSLRYMAGMPIRVAMGAAMDIAGQAVYHGGLPSHPRA